MNSRDRILKRLREQECRLTSPGAWQSRRRFDDLAARFGQALTAVKGELLVVENLEEGVERLDAIWRELDARRIVANDEPLLAQLNLALRRPDLTWHIVGRSPGDLRQFCATADAGLSSATAALAETGSIVVGSGPGRSRLTALLPPVHVALLPASCLTTDLFTWTASRQGALPAQMTFISGPSKTADIEQTMAVGVHGPKRFIVVLVRDLQE
jgi:L-lactate dehydrogenase complex protein LldG